MKDFNIKQFVKNNWRDILRVVIVIFLLLIIILNFDTFRNVDVEGLVQRAGSPWRGFLVVMALFAIKSIVLVVPAALVNIGVGVAFTPFIGVLVNTAGVVVELTTSYYMGYFLGGEFVERQLDKMKRGREYLEDDSRDSGVVMFFLRIIPVFSVNAISMFYGSSHYNYWKYLGISMAGMMPRVVVLSLFGNAIYQYLPSFLG
ncbi:MAG: TVP38/TMEM64 family protein [Clostridia bacterium]|nr:TVP38/TMEM64 family protein [Clostridia bacterium]MBQ8469901.1 TVP38/TMEM64 family protein [Clostridia bacterium]MBR1703826.1 TVP38/TMEM64 family protein [Clostridia bacterium]